MAFLPDEETEPQKPAPQEEGVADGEEKRSLSEAEMKKYTRTRFVNGVLLGAALMLIFMFVFNAGLVTARNFFKKGSENTGARVLTDSSTSAKLKEVEALIEDEYLGDVDSDELSAYMFKGIAYGLGDPYADYYTEEELKEVQDSTRGGYYGIGITLAWNTEEDSFYVGEVYEGSPAEEGGLEIDDRILAVDGEDTAGMDLDGLVSTIRSKEEFEMEIYRPGTKETLTFDLHCSDVSLDYVSYEMQTEKIGYLRITEFTQTAVEQFQEALTALNEAGMEQLIVDLRGNPGGLLTSVLDMLDEILPEGQLIVYTEDKAGNREEYSADDKQSVDCPVAVLIDGNSASGSEIFAGAVQDLDLGPVIGSTSYGKGVVQKNYTLSDGSAFKLTVENYYTPKGQEINGNGITPDIVLEEDGEETEEEDKVLTAAIAYFEEEQDG